MYSITIGFNCKYVRVDSLTLDVVDRLANRFHRMVEKGGKLSCAVFSTRCIGSQYYLDGDEQHNTSFEDFMHLLEYKILDALILANQQFLWIHAGAAALGKAAVLISGSSGCGKSTISTGLCARGWHFVSDDLVPVELESRYMHAFLRAPWFRIPSHRELPPERLIELKKLDVDLDACKVAESSVMLTMLVFPVYSHRSKLTAHRIGGSTVALELAKNIVNFNDHKEQTLSFLAGVTRDIPVWRLEYSDGQQVIDWVDSSFREFLKSVGRDSS